MNARRNAAASCGQIALPAPRRRPTRPGSLGARGKSAGSRGTRRFLPSRQRTIRESDQKDIAFPRAAAASVPAGSPAWRRCSPASPSPPGPAPARRSATRSSACPIGSSPRPPARTASASPPVGLLGPDSAGPHRTFPDDATLPFDPLPSDSATQNNRCRLCGAPTPAAGRSAAPTAYPAPSRSARTRDSHSSPRRLATCSPATTGGRHSATRRKKAGHRCRSSLSARRLPALLNGWQGQLPVQTGHSSGQPARSRARAHPPIPANRCTRRYPASSSGSISRMSRHSTLPFGISPSRTSSSSHAQQAGSLSE